MNALNKCNKKYNPKNKNTLDYYTAQALWECKSNTMKTVSPKKKGRRTKSTNRSKPKSTRKKKSIRKTQK